VEALTERKVKITLDKDVKIAELERALAWLVAHVDPKVIENAPPEFRQRLKDARAKHQGIVR
jgi:hypothetical protein